MSSYFFLKFYFQTQLPEGAPRTHQCSSFHCCQAFFGVEVKVFTICTLVKKISKGFRWSLAYTCKHTQTQTHQCKYTHTKRVKSTPREEKIPDQFSAINLIIAKKSHPLYSAWCMKTVRGISCARLSDFLPVAVQPILFIFSQRADRPVGAAVMADLTDQVSYHTTWAKQPCNNTITGHITMIHCAVQVYFFYWLHYRIDSLDTFALEILSLHLDQNQRFDSSASVTQHTWKYLFVCVRVFVVCVLTRGKSGFLQRCRWRTVSLKNKHIQHEPRETTTFTLIK